MKSIYICLAATLTIFAGAALFRPHMVHAGQGFAPPTKSSALPAPTRGQKVRRAEDFGKPSRSSAAPSGSISTSAYNDLTTAVEANQNSFFVYLNEDAGLNHGFPSGFFGTGPQVTIDPGREMGSGAFLSLLHPRKKGS